MKTILRHPLGWASVALATVVALITTFAYLGAFLDPEGNTRDLPVALVNEDVGATLAGRRLELGSRVAATLVSRETPLGEAVSWTPVPSRDAAFAGIARNEFHAAVVLPRDYSRRLAALAEPARGVPLAARVDVLTNPGAGSLARAATQELATAAVVGISRRIALEIVETDGASARTRSEIAHRIGDAVQVRSVEARAIGEKSARGLSPFYFALMLALAGFLGMVIVNIGVEFAVGHISLDLFALRLHRPVVELSRTALWGVKLVLALAFSLVAGVLQTVLAVAGLGMSATDPRLLVPFAVLGVAAAAMVTLAFLVPFGLAGSLVGVLFITIFGVPSSGGPYPLDMLPGFFRLLAEWLPLRYMTDGARSLVFFDGRLDAGLRGALSVLAAYTLAGALVSGSIAVAIDLYQRRRAARGPGPSSNAAAASR